MGGGVKEGVAAAAAVKRFDEVFSPSSQTFRSLIVTPHMTTSDVLQVAVAQIAPTDSSANFQLIEKTPKGGGPHTVHWTCGHTPHSCATPLYHVPCTELLPPSTERVIGDSECPLLLQTGSTQLLLRRRQNKQTAGSELSPNMSPTSHTPNHHPNSPSTSSPPHTPSSLAVQKSRLALHQDLISALQQFSAVSHQTEEGEATHIASRERVLEQSLVQQHQIVDMLQEMVASLEAEGRASRERVAGLEQKVHHLSMWKARARLAEERLRELAESSGVLGSSSAGMISFTAISGFEKALMEKDQMIASLQSKVGERAESGEERSGAAQSSASVLASSRVKLAAERVRGLELEEQLLSCREEANKARNELADCQSGLMRKESEVQYLRHEVEVLRQAGQQQQDVVMGQRTALMDRDAQVSSLTRALERVSDNRWQKAARVADSFLSHSLPLQTLFELMLGRDVFTLELTRSPESKELGLNVSQVELPVSSRASSLMVRAVRDGSPCHGLLRPGDEILEVNGYSCRSPSQKKAIECLERGAGVIKVVVAREQEPLDFSTHLQSTPVRSESSHSTLWATANDASLLPMSPTQLSHSPSPQHYHLPLPTTPSSSAPPLDDERTALVLESRPQPIGQVRASERTASDHNPTDTSEERPLARERELENLEMEMRKLREEASQKQLLQAELEGELDSVQAELEDLRVEHQLTTAENFDLQQQVKSGEAELAEIQQQVAELQQLLEGVREKVSHEEERTRALEQQSRKLQAELAQAKAAQDMRSQQLAEKEQEVLVAKMEAERESSELASRITKLQSQKEQLEADIGQREAQLEAALSEARGRAEELERVQREFHQQTQQLRTDLQALREESAKTASSSQHELEQLRSQASSARSLLVAAEKTEVEIKLEMRRLQQIAGETSNQLAQMQENDRKLREEVGSYKEQAELKTLESESLTLGLKRAENKLRANKESMTRQQAEIDNLRRNNARLQVECGRAGEGQRKAEVQVRISQSEQAQMREKLQSQGAERDSLFSQLEEAVSESIGLQHQLDGARTQLEEAERQAGCRREEESQLQKRLQDMEAERQDEEAELTRQIKLLKSENLFLQEELEQTRSVSSASLASSQSSSEEVKHEVKRLRSELEQQRHALLSSKQECVRLEKECSAMKQAGEKMQREVAQLQAEKHGLESTAAALKQSAEKASQDAAQTQAVREELTRQRTALKKEVGKLESTVDGLRRAAMESREKCEQLESSRRHVEKQLGQRQHQLSQTLQELDQKREAVQEQSALRETAQSELSLEVAKAEQLRSSMASLEATVESLRAEKRRSDDLVVSMTFVHKQDQTRLEEAEEREAHSKSELEQTHKKFSDLQRETSAELQSVRVQCAQLEEESRGLSAQLEGERRVTEGEVAALKQKLHLSEQSCEHLRRELEAQESANSINHATISQLQATSEQAEEERGRVRKSLQEALQRNHQLQLQLEQLQAHSRQLETENVQLASERDSQLETTADLALQLKQARAQLDTVAAKLQVSELNLAVVQRSLQDAARQERELLGQSSQMKTQLSDSEKQLERAKAKAQEVGLSLHAREEELSRLRARLELTQNEQQQVQRSLAALQSSGKAREKKVKVLETERANLQATVEQLQVAQERLQRSVSGLEREKEYETEQHKQEVEVLSQQVAELMAGEGEQVRKIRQLEAAHAEAQGTVEQLLAAQEALKSSLTALGDKSEGELVRLRDQIVQLEAGTQRQAREARSREEEVRRQLEKASESSRAASESLAQLQEENERLQQEVELQRATEAELAELSSKVGTLEQSLKEKNSRLAAAQGELERAMRELAMAGSKNEELLGAVEELAAVKMALVEKGTELERVRGEVAAEARQRQEVAKERDQLLGVLRKMEVEKHTSIVQQPTPKLSRGADKEQLVEMLKDKEEEALRLRDYVGKLLSAVVEKAPFVLERMS